MSHFKIIFLSFLCFCAFRVSSLPASEPADKALLDELDQVIADRSRYEQQTEDKIKRLNQRLVFTADNPEEQFKVLGELFKVCRSYRVDQALEIAEQRVSLSQRLNARQKQEALMNKADALNKMGFYLEGLSLLRQIAPADSIGQTEYGNYLYHTTYLSLYNEETNAQKKEEYRKQLVRYTAISMKHAAKGTYQYHSGLATWLSYQGKTQEAVRVLENVYLHDRTCESDKASIEYALGNFYLALQDTAQARHYLTLSSITDLKNAKKVYKSLQQLAIILFYQGDVARADSYISCALEDISFGKARYRFDDMTSYLPIINAANRQRTEQRQKTAMLSIGILSFLLVSLAAAFVTIRKKNRKLTEAKAQLNEHNEQLKAISDNLREMNRQIKEKDRIKEEYIGLLFNICSEYVQKQNALYKGLSHIASSGRIADLSKFIGEQQGKSEDAKDFIRRFDTIFLSIFPDFVADFNRLLRPDEQIELKEGELMTPELRIYALIRLGIHDNSKIASFLHYSLQTVYNYRMKMRNKALPDRKNLAQHVLSL